MIIKSDRRIAIFDLDGVLVQYPADAMGSNNVITDADYWSNHWKSPGTAVIQYEMVNLAILLQLTSHHVIILTARPEHYRPWTVAVCNRMGLGVAHSPRSVLDAGYSRPVLHMLPGDVVPNSSAEWKQNTIKDWLDQGAKIDFMVEDYPWNSEAVRALIPVLLYERKKPSKRLLTDFPCCGGMTRCLCPGVRGPNDAAQPVTESN